MLRRLSAAVAPRVAPSVPTTAAATAARRSFFYACPGETGIGGATMRAMLTCTLSFIVFEIIAIRIYVFKMRGTDHQFVQDTTDLYNDDGSVMEGDEAHANLRLQHERIMPFLTEIEEKASA